LHRHSRVIHTDLKPENVLLMHELPSRKQLKSINSSSHVSSSAPIPPAAPVAPDASTTLETTVPNGSHPQLTSEQRKKLKKKLRQKHKRLTTCQPQDREVLENAIAALMERLNISDSHDGHASQYQKQQPLEHVEHADHGNTTLQGHTEIDYQEAIPLAKVINSTEEIMDLSVFDCKIIDLGNACWTHHHFTDQIQVCSYDDACCCLIMT